MQPKTLLIRRYRNVIEISPDGVAPLGLYERSLLSRMLTYQHVRMNYGAQQYDQVTGERHRVSTEMRRLYTVDTAGRLCCQVGFLSRICRTFHGHGYAIQYIDQTPPGPRPDAYEFAWQHCCDNFSFRPRQDEIVLAISQNERGVIKAPPGVGKSYIMAAVCLAYPRAKIAVVIPDVTNVQKTVRTLSQFMPGIGQVGGQRRTRGRVTVYTAGSLQHCDEPPDILLADEIHMLAAASYSQKLVHILAHTRAFGFSATPGGRLDNADMRMEGIFGEIIFEMSHEESRDLGLTAQLEVHWTGVRLPNDPAGGRSDMMLKRHGIWRNAGRNGVIAGVVNSYGVDDQVLVMVDVVEHAVYLKQVLPDFELCYATVDAEKYAQYIRQGLLPDDFTPLRMQDRAQMQRDFESQTLKKVISTRVWGTGVSFDRLQVMVRADASSASEIGDEQLPGRVNRVASGKPFGILRDFRDEFNRTLNGRAKRRRANYNKRGWIQIDH
jgi:hypothetical protein